MSTLVGKKYSFRKNPKWIVEIIGELPNKEYICKWQVDPVSYGPLHVVKTEEHLLKEWKEVRDPRVIYVNEWKRNGVTSLGSQYSSLEDAKGMASCKDYIATRKFIEVLD